MGPSGWRATIRTPPPAMEKAEHGWLNRGSKMYQGLMRGAEVNVGMRQSKRIKCVLQREDGHTNSKQTGYPELFIGKLGNYHSGATNGLIFKLAARSLSLTRDFKKDSSQMPIGRKELFEGPSKCQNQDCSKKNYRLVWNRHADQHEVYQQHRKRTHQHRGSTMLISFLHRRAFITSNKPKGRSLTLQNQK
ncbi:Protein CBG25975 [Caenorhabditis briggsae]|uniref:Protein CBG25975 n=1 Tax=Caenorhabditis briggsae TaxID=6238 RepID=B6IKS5_CAEBR|nr:Protein CBG25975 [Caenorhabditis briggsae]CAS00505.1 Protein CBG25975 [Caenorhabditis briggsae]